MSDVLERAPPSAFVTDGSDWLMLLPSYAEALTLRDRDPLFLPRWVRPARRDELIYAALPTTEEFDSLIVHPDATGLSRSEYTAAAKRHICSDTPSASRPLLNYAAKVAACEAMIARAVRLLHAAPPALLGVSRLDVAALPLGRFAGALGTYCALRSLTLGDVASGAPCDALAGALAVLPRLTRLQVGRVRDAGPLFAAAVGLQSFSARHVGLISAGSGTLARFEVLGMHLPWWRRRPTVCHFTLDAFPALTCVRIGQDAPVSLRTLRSVLRLPQLAFASLYAAAASRGRLLHGPAGLPTYMAEAWGAAAARVAAGEPPFEFRLKLWHPYDLRYAALHSFAWCAGDGSHRVFRRLMAPLMRYRAMVLRGNARAVGNAAHVAWLSTRAPLWVLVMLAQVLGDVEACTWPGIDVGYAQ